MPDETYRIDFEGKQVTTEEFEAFKMTTGEENDEVQTEEQGQAVGLILDRLVNMLLSGVHPEAL